MGGWEVGSYAVSEKSKEGLVSAPLMEHKHFSNFNILWLHLFQMQTAALAVSLSIGFAKKGTPCLPFLFPFVLRQEGSLPDN